MRALVITEYGGPDVLKVEERPAPEPGDGEVRVAVKAAGINFADLLARQGLYSDAPKAPCVVGYEFAGEVESVGSDVSDVQPGQRVMGGCRFGGQSELVVTKPDNLVPLPDDWSFAEGAALPVVYATAYAALVRYGSVREGERVLLQAAAGGVGIAATQIAKLTGAGEVFGTASASKHDAIRGFGVDHPIDYANTDFRKEIRRITGEKQPLDFVLDGVGGASFRKGWSMLRAGGRMVGIGASSVSGGDKRSIPKVAKMLANTPVFHPLPMMQTSRGFIGLNMLTLWDSKGSLEEYIEPLRKWIDEGALRPVVAEEFPLDKGADAHRFIQERKNVGKVVLTV
jgi:NADPH:quinone reductase-like Zn-dependent oxidoreductase